MNSECISLNGISERIGNNIDLFVCSASYEGRCRSVADQLPVSNVKCAVVAEQEHSARYMSGNGEYLRERFRSATIPVMLDPANPLVTADGLHMGIGKGMPASGGRVLVDVTTFTHESLLMLLKILSFVVTANHEIRFAYVGAAEYSVGEPDELKWLSKGVSEVRSVLGYPGLMLPSRRQHLIVLVGFEHERAAELIRTYEPSLISLGHGSAGTALEDRHQAANERFHRLVAAMASTYGDVRHFEFSCNDPLDAQRAIERQVRVGRGYNTVVAPMNTKLSTLGAALAAQSDDTIQLCYARANQYNYKGYSIPGDKCFLIELPEMFEHA